MVEQGTIIYQRYEIGCRYPPKGIPVENVVAALSKLCKVKEVVLNNIRHGKDSIPVSKGGFTAYVAFRSVDEALSFPTEIEVEGETAKLWHRGKYECETCKEKGHTQDYHEKLMLQRANVDKRRQRHNERKRKREERKARG